MEFAFIPRVYDWKLIFLCSVSFHGQNQIAIACFCLMVLCTLNLHISDRGHYYPDFSCDHSTSSFAFVMEAIVSQNPYTPFFNKYTVELVAYVQGES